MIRFLSYVLVFGAGIFVGVHCYATIQGMHLQVASGQTSFHPFGP